MTDDAARREAAIHHGLGKHRNEQPLDVWDDAGNIDPGKVALIEAQVSNWPSDQRAAMLAELRAAVVRARVRSIYRHPAEIALACDETFVMTPAVELTSRAIERVLRSPKPINLLITEPPQEGKSTLGVKWTGIRKLQLDPDHNIIATSYGDDLVLRHSREIRDVIDTHGTGVVNTLTGLPVEDKVGLRLKAGANRIDAWSVEGGKGGFVARGVGSSITGVKGDLIIIDDPFKNMMEADSKTQREKVYDWYSSVILTRRAPSASTILIMTRWHPEDLAGKVLAAERSFAPEDRTWKHINIPAISEDGIKDSLRRPRPGIPMISARDTPEAKRNFEKTRREVGERTWYALYQGSPRNPSGGLFSRSWFDPRLSDTPLYPVMAVVGVDPADSGEGDEAGIIAGVLCQDGRVAFIHDRSGKYTSDQWAREAVLLAIEVGAREIAVEAYTSSTTYVRVVRQAYQAIVREAVDKHANGAALNPIEQRALVSGFEPPFLITKWRGASKADAVARSAGLRQAFETKRAVTVEHRLAVFENQAADWQDGQHQPDRVAAGVIVYDKLAGSGGGLQTASPVNRTPPPPPAWMRRKMGN